MKKINPNQKKSIKIELPKEYWDSFAAISPDELLSKILVRHFIKQDALTEFIHSRNTEQDRNENPDKAFQKTMNFVPLLYAFQEALNDEVPLDVLIYCQYLSIKQVELLKGLEAKEEIINLEQKFSDTCTDLIQKRLREIKKVVEINKINVSFDNAKTKEDLEDLDITDDEV